MTDTITEKKCSKCGLMKSLEEFHVDKKKRCGVRSQCKNCANTRLPGKKLQRIEALQNFFLEFHREGKRCGRCNTIKFIEDFSLCRAKKDGRNNWCRVCSNAGTKVWRDKNLKRADCENVPKNELGDRKLCNGCGLIKPVVEFSINKHQKDMRQTQCKGCGSVRSKQRKQEASLRDRTRRHTEPLYRLRGGVRALIRGALVNRGFTKTSKTAQILGCTWQELKHHLENQFWPGMTWDNVGEWHIDHEIPVSSATTEEETLRLNHYLNLQPLWADDNLIKSDRTDWTPAESTHPSHETDY